MLRLLPLTPPSEPTITQPTTPRRKDLRGDRVHLLKQGSPTKADLLTVDLGAGGRLVVKDFASKPWWVRWVGRLQIARECRAYRWLGPSPCVPRFFGRIDAHALALEWIPSVELAKSPLRRENGVELLARLSAVVGLLHGVGLAHLDLRGRENVIIDGEGRVFVLDLASAIWLRPGGLAHRLLFHRLAWTDQAALLKWKRLLEAGPYTAEERSFLERFRFWRGLWPFNRKGTARPKTRG